MIIVAAVENACHVRKARMDRLRFKTMFVSRGENAEIRSLYFSSTFRDTSDGKDGAESADLRLLHLCHGRRPDMRVRHSVPAPSG